MEFKRKEISPPEHTEESLKETKEKPSTPKKVLTGLGVFVLLVVSLCLTFNNQLGHWLLDMRSSTYQLASVSKAAIKENQEKKVSFDFNQVQSISPYQALFTKWGNQNYPVIGGVAVPELGIKLPIFKGVNNDALFYGAGTLKEEQVMGKGNFVLAGHHIFDAWGDTSPLLFSPLRAAKEGQHIYLTDKTKLYDYKIDQIEVVTSTIQDKQGAKEGNYFLDNVGKNQVTLITCNNLEATQRIIVQGSLVASRDFKEADAELF